MCYMMQNKNIHANEVMQISIFVFLYDFPRVVFQWFYFLEIF
jgi:hypothetical protein